MLNALMIRVTRSRDSAELKNVIIVLLITRPDRVFTSEPVGLSRVGALRQLNSD